MLEPKKPMKKKELIRLDEEIASKLQAEFDEEVRLAREKAEKEKEANIVSYDNVQAMIDADYQMAQQMQGEEQEKLSIKEKSKLFVQLLEVRKKHFAVMRAQEKRNKPLTKAQKKNTMSTYLKNMVVYKHNQLKNKSFDDIQKLFNKAMKRVKHIYRYGNRIGGRGVTDQTTHPTITQNPSTSQPKKTQKPRKPKRKNTKVPQPSGSTEHVADEVVNEEMDDSLVRAATTASSLEAELVLVAKSIGNRSKATLNEPNPHGTGSCSGPRCQETMGDTIAQTRFENVSKTSYDSLLTGVKTPRSDEDIMKLKELMEFCTKLQQRFGLSGDASKQGRIDDIDKDAKITLVDENSGEDMAEKEVNVAEKKVSIANPVTTTGEVVTTASVAISTTKPTETTFTNDLTLAQTLLEIISAKPKFKWVVIGKANMEEPEKPTKRKDQIRHDEEVAQRLQAQLQAELEEEDRFVRQREDEANIVSWDNVQAMIDADYQMALQMKQKETRKRAGDELEQESIKKQKVDQDKETSELKCLMEVILDEQEVAIDVIPLATKPPTTIDWKIHKEGKNNYYKIIRADESLKMYKVFSLMLKSFDRQDLEDLYNLVKAKYRSTRLVEDLDLILYGDLKTIFDPHVED
ncbi:hypothetical protein Tco_1204241 [Tanacetum coccineum]